MILNYRYEFFPTAPQRKKLFRIFRENRLQWNRAVIVRRKLIASLRSGQFEHVLNTIFSEERNNSQGVRRAAIEREFPEELHPGLSLERRGELYDLRRFLGKALYAELTEGADAASPPQLRSSFVDMARREAQERRANPQGKSPCHWILRKGIDRYAGWKALQYVRRSFASSMPLASIRVAVSDPGASQGWKTATTPTPEQRANGATGDPRCRRRGGRESFRLQIASRIARNIDRFIRKKSGSRALACLSFLPEGMQWAPVAYHRDIPEGSAIKEISVLSEAERFFVVYSIDVPDDHEACRIDTVDAGLQCGFDPGATTALTGVVRNGEGELSVMEFSFSPLEKSLKKLEVLQQRMDKMQGPRRRDAGGKFLRGHAGRQRPSRRYLLAMRELKQLHFHIRRQREDVHHKLSRGLVETMDVIAIGNWEPPKQVNYRKELKKLEKRAARDIPGAKEALEEHRQKEQKNAGRGVVRMRRGGRDRALASLKMKIAEKVLRTGKPIRFDGNVDERYSTVSCSSCGEHTGPKGELDVREWTCSACNTTHRRDVNAALNILNTYNCPAKGQASSSEARNSGRGCPQGERPRDVIDVRPSTAESMRPGNSWNYGNCGSGSLRSLAGMNILVHGL